MSNQSLVGTLPIYAQHLAELTGVTVHVEGVQAKTDGKNVFVPFTDDDLPLSFGYIAHECSHVRNTDMGCFRDSCSTPFRKNLLNILEDIRIERLSMDQYPGTEPDIRYLNRKVLLEPFRPEQVDECPALHVIHNGILYGGYWLLQEPQLEVPAKAYLARMETLLGNDLTDKILTLVKNTLACESTTDVLGLVDAIIDLLPSQEDEQGDEQLQPEQGAEGAPQDSQQSGGGDQHQEPKQAGAGSDDQGKEEGQPESKQETSDGGQSGSKPQDQSQPSSGSDAGVTSHSSNGSGKPSPEASNLREQAKDATEADLKGLISEVGDKAGELLGRNAVRDGNPVRPFSLDGRGRNRSDEASVRRVQLGIEQSAGLRQCLNGLLQAHVDCRVRLKRQGKRIDTGRIAMMKGGETRVFRSKSRAERQSASIQILLDKSGSMKSAMDQAEAAVYAVLSALEGLPLVTTGAMSFPNKTNDGVERCALIKSPKERLIRAVSEGGFGARSEGLTPLAQALWPAAVEVLRAKGEKKILFVITDGEPNAGTTHAAKEFIQRCEVSGIEVIGLGFGNAKEHILKALFSQYRAVGEVANLKNSLFELVREALAA
ncbi:VWA domain-containing protein [Pseudomonas sp. WS 5021]|uniref:VWA domain-containing protein n=1 Tax=Pseudomonas hygromyciniae TaxID=2812000 RepID=A0ABX7K4B4_9PSED|nr:MULTISPECIES: VWA domain-containing protein [Pseudomonas]MBN0979676.1 VWA domain-containing protein [Pseudomonas hygromyciniae]NMX35818.1 VWA domain-containing protein [Pseudomonas sp. WS 5413]NMY29674.1 VWA domain-containing protein [Pseudomonas sp. WS 5021]QSB42491.1 VWA domain-containing protein [Pseudomonas hygromyciniae]